MTIMTEKIDDLIHVHPANVVRKYAKIRSNLTRISGGWETFNIGGDEVNCSQEHIASEASFVIAYSGTKLNAKTAAAALVQYSEVEIYAEASAPSTAGVITTTRRIFQGFIDTLDINQLEVGVHCYDPLAFWGRCFYNFGAFEAQVVKITSSASDPTAYPVPPPAPIGIVNGISLVPVSESGETRWVIPYAFSAIVTPPVWTDLYTDAYTGVPENESVVTYNGYKWRVGTNRRPIKVAGQIFDDQLDLTGYGQEVEYPDPVPKSYYGIGTDLANYFEFYSYPPTGMHVGDATIFVSWVDVFLEGTNDIEHILLKCVSPTIKGLCTADDAGTQLTASLSNFIRDSLLADGAFATVTNMRTGATALLASVDSQTQITHASLAGGSGGDNSWNIGDSFEITNAVELSPRLINGYHYKYDSTLTYDTATQADYFEKTIWPSGTTITRIAWNESNGSLLNLIETLLNEHAPPNYRIWWDHEYGMLRAQFVEQMPFNPDTFYYGQANPSYQGFAYGKFLNTTPPQPADGTNDFHHLNIAADVASPTDDEGFGSSIIVEGVREHPINAVKSGQSMIYTQCPGQPQEASWEHTGDDLQHWWLITHIGDHDTSRTYADVHDPQGADGLILIRQNLTDLVAKTCISWETSSFPDMDLFQPTYVIDLGEITEVGHLKLLGMTTLRPEFTWGLRIECCDADGVAFTGGGQGYANPTAAWELMHPSFYQYQLHGYEEVHIQGGWLRNTCRYIRISMSPAKTNSGSWFGKATYYKTGLAEIQVYRSDTVKGYARIGSLSNLVFGTVDTKTPSTSALYSTAAIFGAGDVGDEVVNLTQGFTATISGFTSSQHVTTTSVGTWQPGDKFVIVDPIDANPGIGYWKRYRVTYGTDPEQWGLDGAVSILNLPILYARTVGGANAVWGFPTGKLTTGHKTMYHQNTSLGDTNSCADRAEEILIETIRRYAMAGASCRWHNHLQLYQCVQVSDRRTGLLFKAFVENVTYKGGGVEFDSTVFFDYAWTGEEPQAL